MADTKISNLAAVTDVLGTDEYVLARSGATKKITAANLQTGIAPSGNPPGTEFDYAEITSSVNVSATVESTPDNVISGASVAYDGSTEVIIEVYAPYLSAGSSGVLVLNLWDGSTDLGRIVQAAPPSAGALSTPCFGRRKLTPSNASHTYHIKAWRVTANGVVVAGAGGAGNYMPAYMRITVA